MPNTEWIHSKILLWEKSKKKKIYKSVEDTMSLIILEVSKYKNGW